MNLACWLRRDDQEQAWMLEMHTRLRRVSVVAVGVLSAFVLASTPWLSPLSAIPIGVAALAFGLGHWFTGRRTRIEPMLAGWLVAQAMIAVAVGVNGRQHSGDLALLMFGVVGACGGFTTRIVVGCVAWTIGWMVAVSLGWDGVTALADPPVLLIPVGMVLSVAVISTAVRRASMEHRTAAVIDELTGLLNRNALTTRTTELEHQSALTGDPVAVIVADVDRFKRVNDDHGHAFGDRVLVEIADRIRKELRAFDLAYRLGGEEFVVVVPGAESADAIRIAGQLHAAIGGDPIGDRPITISLGVAASRRGEAFRFGDVFEAADAALYTAKRNGRDRVCSADDGAAHGSALTAAVSPAY